MSTRPRRDGNALYYNQIDPPRNHFIEQAVQVYLRLSDDGTRWIVDGPTVDGHCLDSAREDLHATNSECACERPTECRQVLEGRRHPAAAHRGRTRRPHRRSPRRPFPALSRTHQKGTPP